MSVLYVAVGTDFRYLPQKIVLAISPSAERAYAYGNEKFDAQLPEDYDPVQAQKMYELALQLDPSMPYVRHQLARLEFLKGNFEAALVLIDAEIAMLNGPASPSSYYIRGLINGFAGNYTEAIRDYETYLALDPTNWAGTADYAWVLLKVNRSGTALLAINKVIDLWPDNPWLLNSKAIALSDLGMTEEAKRVGAKAVARVNVLTNEEWSHAYPGNDPLIAQEGVAAFRKAVRENFTFISSQTGALVR